MYKISIITVSYNCRNDIQKTMASVFSQTYPRIEYIIIDGASTDGTAEIIKKQSAKLSYFISESDNGIYDAMNKGLDIATGDWVFYLNAGDELSNRHIISNIFSHQCDSAINAIYGDVISLTNKGKVLMKSNRPFFSKSHKYLSMGLSHQGIFVKLSIAKKLHFDLSYQCCADYNMIFQIYNKYEGGFLYFSDEPISLIEGRKGFSHVHIKRQRYEEARILGLEKTMHFHVINLWRTSKEFAHKIISSN